MNQGPTDRVCPCCDRGASSVIQKYSPEPWIIATCKSCGFTYLRNPPVYEAFVEEFAWEKTYEKKKTLGGSTAFSRTNRAARNFVGYKSRSRATKMLDIFRTGNVLDIGCGDGQRLHPPLVPYGIELSASLHQKADQAMRNRGGYCLHAPGAEGIWQFEPEMFDGILMNSYLEHEVNTMKVLKGAARVLKQDGQIFIRVPNFGSLNRRVIGNKWCGFRYPDHVNYFTLPSLREIAARAGFQTRLVNKFNLWVDDNIHVLLTKSQAH
jgi:SAM-dependent methyltransferase